MNLIHRHWLVLICAALAASLAGISSADDFAADGKPVIGINMDVNGSTTGTARLTLPSTYMDAVAAAGGIPIILPPVESRDDVRRLVAMVDGIVLTGGRDITPARYGQEPHEKTSLIHPRREQFDFMLIEEALLANKPILGVCLGMQELNVALGGQLIQDIPALTDSEIDHRPGISGRHLAHDVAVAEGSKLAALTGLASFSVNSMHHQACVNPGPGVIVSARSPDGLIESIEAAGRAFVVGVQWHPEHFTDVPEHLGIFKGLIEAAKSARAANEQPLAITAE